MQIEKTRAKLLSAVAVLLAATSAQMMQAAEPADQPATTASCSQYMAPKRTISGKTVGQTDCFMQDHGIVDANQKLHRIDIGVSGTLSGWIVKQGARQNYFTSGPDFTFSQYGNPHSPRFHGILTYTADRGTSLTLTYPETGWNGKVFVMVHGRSGSFLKGSNRPWDKYFNPEKAVDLNRFERSMIERGYAVARTRRNADGFAVGDFSAVLDDGTVWPDLNMTMIPELILDEVRMVNNLLKEKLGRKPTRNYWYGHSAGAYSGLATNYMLVSNPDLNKDADGKETISGFIDDDPGGGLFIPVLVKNGQDTLYRSPQEKAKFVKSIVIAHQAYPLVYSNVVPGEMDLTDLPEGISPTALTNKRTMSRTFKDKGIENVRMYEVRGISHNGGENLPPSNKDRDVQMINFSRLMDAAIDLLDNWVEKGVAPPPSRSDVPGIAALTDGIALPEIACPLGEYYAFPQLRGVDGGVGSTGFAPYDGKSLEPLNGQLMLVDMNKDGKRNVRESVTEAWRRIGLLKSGETFSRDKYVACVQSAIAKLRKDSFLTEKSANAYVEEARASEFPSN
jgi:hypothetical protein